MGNVCSHLRAAGKAVANSLIVLMAVHVVFLFIILSLTQYQQASVMAEMTGFVVHQARAETHPGRLQALAATRVICNTDVSFKLHHIIQVASHHRGGLTLTHACVYAGDIICMP
jgi:hypothetical protein